MAPTCGSCSFLGTANTMCCVAEAMGMCLPGSATIPATHAARLRSAQEAGRQIVELVRRGITARQIINRKGIENAIRLGTAIGGSTNLALHIPAIAYEADCGRDHDGRAGGAVAQHAARGQDEPGCGVPTCPTSMPPAACRR